jgi:hypothetical protein
MAELLLHEFGNINTSNIVLLVNAAVLSISIAGVYELKIRILYCVEAIEPINCFE